MLLKTLKPIFISVTIIALAGCSTGKPTIEQLYEAACKDSLNATQEKVKHLVEITHQSEDVKWNNEEKVLMCSFHHFPDSYKEGTTVTTSWGESWLVSVKEFSNEYKKEKGKFTDYLLRTKQFMGVDPNKAHTHISSFYVDPNDLFRPAFEPDITKQITKLSLPDDASNEFKTWFKDNAYYSYFEAEPRLPWTRLGYTYDWAEGDNHYGLSEFILKKGSTINIEKTAEPKDFFDYLETI